MNTLTSKTVTINRTIKEVYKFTTNMENFKSWFPKVIKIESNNSLNHAIVGKKYIETVIVPFKGESIISLNVVKAEENKIFITEGDFSPLFPKMTIKFHENSSNTTTLTWCMQSRNTNLIFTSLLLPIFKKIMNKRAKIGVQNLKTILEK
ncbi:SRPBCC family protein [Aureibaculum algae]|uniref:SRPBCC family protein n=1 Tax=Aureibaculum algae TaxID=2584122 RepID=A0A5B7TXK9_9FLAO|nr:SRPBCC family protein [Aureibaculum algae]QCX39050.1 SRPBCC family protein [Aureibaculum algae]QCX39886.1 SRPBCC family protein [Aureibaculum algae]